MINPLLFVLAFDIFSSGQFIGPDTYEISVWTDQPLQTNALDVTVTTDGQFVIPVSESYVLDPDYIFQSRPPVSPILSQFSQSLAFNDFALMIPTLDNNPVLVAQFDLLQHGNLQWDGVIWDSSGEPPQVFAGNQAIPEPNAIWLLSLIFLLKRRTKRLCV
jgi:hypothetical protein